MIAQAPREPDTECRVCGYRWVKNVPSPKSCPDCKRRRVARPIEKEVADE